MRYIMKVRVPFHYALMLPAQERLGAGLDGIEFKDLGVLLVTKVDAAIIRPAPSTSRSPTRFRGPCASANRSSF